MRLPVLIRSWSVSLWRNERGVVLAMALVVMVLLMGVGSTALFSGYTNLLTSTNLKLATRARATAEAAVNETLYRLSRQEGKPGAIVPNLANSNWEVHIMPNGSSSAGPPIQVATIQATGDWPHAASTPPVVVRYKKDASGKVIFYDRTNDPPLCITPPFCAISLPAPAEPNPNAIPASAHPVIQILATGLDEREAERQILAEVVGATAFAPPAPLSSGIDVDLGGSGFLDGVNHDHRIYITPGSGSSAMYGDANSETTDNNSPVKDSPDDNKLTSGSGHGIANPTAPVPDCANPNPSLRPPCCSDSSGCNSYARLFNRQISSTNTASAWLGLTPQSGGTWSGVNQGYASAIAFSSTHTANRVNSPTSGVWTKGVFTWSMSSVSGAVGYSSSCSPATTLACRPAVLTHSADSFSSTVHFPFFQEFLGLDDASFQNLLDNPDTTRADLNAGGPPLGFIYIQGDYTFNNSTASPGTNDFGLLYVTGSLTINGNQTFKGVIFIDGSLHISGSPVILGAVMVRGSTNITVGTGNMKLLYSRRAAELGLQVAHAWRVLSWEDTAMQ